MNKHHTLTDGTEILLGLDLHGRWSVSHWDKDLNLLSSSKFKDYNDALNMFEEWSDETQSSSSAPTTR